MRLISAGGQFVRYMCHVSPPLAERLIHLLQTLEIWMTVSAGAPDRPDLRSQSIVKLQYNPEDIDQAHVHLFPAHV